ncbi:unnamed protein product [Callosobruchus maculatus]|uniref:MD-2-related lipid-recognition domain-containing protein n=1 Tax=Callosobruchus maculatus TaxID=64391 RepID=A0A653D8J1_CALMS|nr:unnamed protein product [Callosobruchus maculatus]
MKSVFALLVAIWQFQIAQCSFDAAVAVWNTEVIPTAVYPCKDVDPISYSEMELKDDGNEKWLEFLFQAEDPLDKTIYAKLTIDQWKNGDWEENIYNNDGNFCEMRDKFYSKAWTKLTEAAQPKTDPKECNIPTGTYVGKKFQLQAEDLDIPSMLFGTFRVRNELYTEDNELYLCTVIELESNRKE